MTEQRDVAKAVSDQIVGLVLDIVDVMQPKWQPIETAPKDGTEVVLAAWNDGLEKWLFGVGAMHITRWRWEYSLEPTHWMPLPDPPQGEQG